MTAPKISVLMPAYNSEKYIAEAIESILNQTFGDFEFIIINDGSTDATPEIIRKYNDSRIRFIDNPNNQGLITVLNQGLELARGEYIARMDSDDISVPERLELQVDYMDKHPDVGVLGGWCLKFTNDGKTQILKMLENPGLLDLFSHGNLVSHPSVMMRAAVLKKYGLKYDINYPHAEDFALWVQFAIVSKIYALPRVLVKYRWHGENVCIKYHDQQLDSDRRIRKSIVDILTSSSKLAGLLNRITCETNEYIRLFGIIPLIRTKQYGITKTKYYLPGKLPLVRVQDKKLYLFDLIKIGVIK